MTAAMLAVSAALIVAFGFAEAPQGSITYGLHPLVKVGGMCLIFGPGLLVQFADHLSDGNVGADE